MSVKIICDRCRKKYELKDWYGYFYDIETSDRRRQKFHICRSCQDDLDYDLARRLKGFLKLEKDVIDWAVIPCNKK